MLHLHKIKDLLEELQKQEKDLQQLTPEQRFATPAQRLVQLESSTFRMHLYNSRREEMLSSLEEEISRYESSTPLVDRIAQMLGQVNAVNEALDYMYEINVCSICELKCEPHGRHVLVSLPCGHLFGRNCIHKVLRESYRCPSCSRGALHHHVRRIYGLSFYPF
ncbi:E3 ubiquitin-protein ligase RFWD3 [Drosophila teissieri]|uniref:E3 ubiquitin-protein ligase RFWD3 n=1 Tax=Drosophila teissieri TaxID=7243 RepID=UPI001CBA2DF0|nr:E3 ubiquitin-protein ligase RFWD3 [Drosophila teissieri]